MSRADHKFKQGKIFGGPPLGPLHVTEVKKLMQFEKSYRPTDLFCLCTYDYDDQKRLDSVDAC